MTIKIALNVSSPYVNDALFDPNSLCNRDDCLAPWRILKNQGGRIDIEFHTTDIYLKRREIPDIVIFFDIPVKGIKGSLPEWSEKVIKWAIIFENELICPWNWERERHAEFEKIFTWNDGYIDNAKYIKINYSFQFPEKIINNIPKINLCTLITGNKSSLHPLGLYRQRKDAIKWFEAYHPDEFDFYGIGWDKHSFPNTFPLRYLNRIKMLTSICVPSYKTYKGIVDSKIVTFSKYRFSICYENARDIQGYITEKIFDSLFAGCIPVYWGAPNISDHIPKNCYIDKREFKSYDDLYRHMKSINELAYNKFIDNINLFLFSDQAYPFTCDCFAKTILKEITR